MAALSTSSPSRFHRPLAAALLSLAAGAGAAAGASVPAVHTGRGCYLVGQRVALRGSGFAPSREYVVSIDDVYFGNNTTNSRGGFQSALRPGGLGAGVAQAVEHVEATDGTVAARTDFTLTRAAGARLLVAGGNPRTLRAPFQVWAFALDGRRRPVYLHYVSPSGAVTLTASLGAATGQCGYLLTASRRLFPFTPTTGGWTLQLDTRHGYARRPRGPVARIGVRIS
jgi:hypothetical protein